MQGLTGRERRRIRNQQDILDTAYEIVRSQGMDALSIRTLAQESGYSPATLYKYFENKDAIIKALQDQIVDRMNVRAAEQTPSGLEPAEALYQSALIYLQVAMDHPEDYLLAYNAGSIYNNFEEISAHPGYDSLRQLTAEGIACGQLVLPRGHTLETLVLQHWVTAHGTVMLRLSLLTNPGPTFDQLALEMLRAYMLSITHPDIKLSFQEQTES